MICPSFLMDDLGTNPDTDLKHNRIITLSRGVMFVEYDSTGNYAEIVGSICS
jgi:hypothetical protein